MCAPRSKLVPYTMSLFEKLLVFICNFIIEPIANWLITLLMATDKTHTAVGLDKATVQTATYAKIIIWNFISYITSAFKMAMDSTSSAVPKENPVSTPVAKPAPINSASLDELLLQSTTTR